MIQENGVIKTEYINTRQHLADFLKKPLGGSLFLRLWSEAGIYYFDNGCKWYVVYMMVSELL